jgi:hypothetical protein
MVWVRIAETDPIDHASQQSSLAKTTGWTSSVIWFIRLIHFNHHISWFFCRLRQQVSSADAAAVAAADDDIDVIKAVFTSQMAPYR